MWNECIKKGGTSVWKEGMREKEDPLLTAGNLDSQKPKKGGGNSAVATHPYRVTLNIDMFLVFLFLWGVFRFLTRAIFLFFSLSLHLLSISSFLHSFNLSQHYTGVLRPVPSRNPSLHLCVHVQHRCRFPVFLNLFYCYRLRVHWHSPTFPLSSVFWGGWQASFQVTGNCYCSRSQLETCSHSLSWRYAHTQLHTCSFCSPHDTLQMASTAI